MIYALYKWNHQANISEELSSEKTPAIIALLTYTTDRIYNELIKIQKHQYKRKRPFIVYAEPTCYKKDEAELHDDYSYPSGHSASAWIIALVLTELAPERTGQLIKHGFEVGQSRVICVYHWQSDVDVARPIATAFLAKLHGRQRMRLGI